ncbi:MAG TPA: hypothetical protein PLN48_15840 [Lachnospiraceae bacterium]|nr:hypothetical protein [Lachnospiraceae bacterium]
MKTGIAGDANAKELKNNAWLFLKMVLFPFAAALLLEMLVFNFHAYMPGILHEKSRGIALPEETDLSGVTASAGALIVGDDGGTVTIRDVGTSVSNICLKADGNSKLLNVTIQVTDESNSASPYTLGSFSFCTDTASSLSLYAVSTGKAKTLVLSFDQNAKGLCIRGITVNGPVFHFSRLRFLVVYLLFFLFAGIKEGKAWRIVYSPKSRLQNTLLAVILAFCCFIPVVTAHYYHDISNEDVTPFLEDMDYPLTDDIENYNIYEQQFDAFLKGQLYLDIPVDTNLLSLENPYDKTERAAAGVLYAWDHAFYHGKYYSYYGTAPILVFYYPYFFLTGKVPSLLHAMEFFSIMSILAVSLLLREILLKFVRRINYLLLCLGLPALCFTTLIYATQAQISFYVMPYLSEILFAALFMFLSLRALRAGCLPARVLLIFAGIAYALSVASRPIAALFILPMLPFFIRVLKNREETLKDSLIKMLCFAIPTAVGAVLIMRYNYLRFGSPLQFGIIYQLTISDASKMKFTIYDIIPAIYHMFLQLPYINARFPFAHIVVSQLSNYAGYKLHIAMLGAFSFPMLWWLFPGRAALKKNAENERMFAFLSAAVSLFMAFASFAMSGTDMRYIMDFVWLLGILALVFMMQIQENCFAETADADVRSSRKILYGLAVISLLASVWVGFAAVFNNEGDVIKNDLPAVYAAVMKLCEFW